MRRALFITLGYFRGLCAERRVQCVACTERAFHSVTCTLRAFQHNPYKTK
jgi:hypothetical protein